MLIADLRHFVRLPADAPGPAVRLAEHLTAIVKAASAGDVRVTWETALPCRRRPNRRRCPGRMMVQRTDPGEPIRWQCSVCDDGGLISNWEDSPHDLRRKRLTVAGNVREIVVPDEVVAALRDLRLLDPDGERVVFRTRSGPDCAVLIASEDELDELIADAIAEARHEITPRRRRRLEIAVDALRSAQAVGR